MSEIYTGSMSSSEQAQVRLGGMALRNGVLVQGPDHWAAAVRTPEGEIRMASGRKPELPAPALSVPGLRGVLRVAEAIYLLPLVRRRLPEARLPMEGATTAGALAASLVLTRVLRAGRVRPLTAEVAGAGISLLPALASLRSSQLARYHGAEHKAIGGYERGADAEEQSTEHERCGSHLVAPMLAATVAGNALVSPAARRPPRPRPAGRQLRRGRDRHRDLRVDPAQSPEPCGADDAAARVRAAAARRRPASRPLTSSRSPAPRCDEVLRLEDSGGRP